MHLSNENQAQLLGDLLLESTSLAVFVVKEVFDIIIDQLKKLKYLDLISWYFLTIERKQNLEGDCITPLSSSKKLVCLPCWSVS